MAVNEAGIKNGGQLASQVASKLELAYRSECELKIALLRRMSVHNPQEELDKFRNDVKAAREMLDVAAKGTRYWGMLRDHDRRLKVLEKYAKKVTLDD